MADYWPAANGSWSTLSNWLTATGVTAGVLPTSTDDVYADGKTITIDISTRVNSIRTTQRTGGTIGGTFNISNNISLTASVFAGSTSCLVFNLASPNSATLVGNAVGGSSSGASGVAVSNTGTLNVVGNLSASVFNRGYGGGFSAAGTLNVVGDIVANSGSGTAAFGVLVNSSGTLNLTGNAYGSRQTATGTNFSSGLAIETTPGSIRVIGGVYGGATASVYGINLADLANSSVSVSGIIVGGSGTNAHGISNSNSTITINVTGTVLGGSGTTAYGISHGTASSVYIYGTAKGGITAPGVNNSSTGFLYCTKVVGNDYGLGSAGIGSVVGASNSQNGRMYVEQVEFGIRGQTPITGPVYILPSNQNTLVGYTTATGSTVTFYNSLSVSGLMPPASSVRLGTVYNVGNTTGTMAVPSASAVEFGVPVDNTVGVAALTPQTVWGYSRLSATDVGSMGDRLRNAATAQSVGSQIASFNL